MQSTLLPLIIFLMASFVTSSIINSNIYHSSTGRVFKPNSFSNLESNPELKIVLRFIKYDDEKNIKKNFESDLVTEYNTETIPLDNPYSNQGLKKNQWHNYPRQLDRLQIVLEKKNNVDHANPADQFHAYVTSKAPYFKEKKLLNNYLTRLLTLRNAITNENNVNTDNNIELEDNKESQYWRIGLPDSLEVKNTDLNINFEDVWEKPIDESSDPISQSLHTYEEGSDPALTYSDATKNSDSNIRVSKRIFSLWTRMQGMKHDGREIMYRRHYHAFHSPRMFRGDNLSAETRGMARPPGSPLRWG